MARKHNQKALYEAIRQGQMKIAEGLKTGHMRSDRQRFASGVSQPRSYGGADDNPSGEGAYEYSSSSMSPKAVLIGAAVVVQIVILILGIWFGAVFFRNRGETVQTANSTSSAAGAVAETEQASRRSTPIMSVPDRQVSPVSYQVQDNPTTLPEVQPTAATRSIDQTPEPVNTGGNVIVIQGIQAGRKDELLPLKDYFGKNGVETEVIVRNGYGLLVTKAGFDVNPESRGTAGFELMQRVRKLGIAYPQATGDTKFGLKPFQDSYGLLK